MDDGKWRLCKILVIFMSLHIRASTAGEFEEFWGLNRERTPDQRAFSALQTLSKILTDEDDGTDRTRLSVPIEHSPVDRSFDDETDDEDDKRHPIDKDIEKIFRSEKFKDYLEDEVMSDRKSDTNEGSDETISIKRKRGYDDEDFEDFRGRRRNRKRKKDDLDDDYDDDILDEEDRRPTAGARRQRPGGRRGRRFRVVLDDVDLLGVSKLNRLRGSLDPSPHAFATPYSIRPPTRIIRKTYYVIPSRTSMVPQAMRPKVMVPPAPAHPEIEVIKEVEPVPPPPPPPISETVVVPSISRAPPPRAVSITYITPPEDYSRYKVGLSPSSSYEPVSAPRTTVKYIERPAMRYKTYSAAYPTYGRVSYYDPKPVHTQRVYTAYTHSQGAPSLFPPPPPPLIPETSIIYESEARSSKVPTYDSYSVSRTYVRPVNDDKNTNHFDHHNSNHAHHEQSAPSSDMPYNQREVDFQSRLSNHRVPTTGSSSSASSAPPVFIDHSSPSSNTNAFSGPHSSGNSFSNMHSSQFPSFMGSSSSDFNSQPNSFSSINSNAPSSFSDFHSSSSGFSHQERFPADHGVFRYNEFDELNKERYHDSSFNQRSPNFFNNDVRAMDETRMFNMNGGFDRFRSQKRNDDSSISDGLNKDYSILSKTA